MVKHGYKQTEIGVIPEDWDCIMLKDVCQFIGGGTPSKTIPEFWNGNIPWVSSSDIVDGDIYTININRHITEKAISLSATHKCPQGTILVVSRVGVGKVAISNCEVCTSQDFTNLIPKNHEPLFLTYVLVPIMQGKATETQGTSIKGVTTENIKRTKVVFPPFDEQKSIAEALSDVDSMISSLEKLIAKKKAVKQGAMQELLTGRKRLPGFTGEWVHMELGKYGSLMKETINPQLYSSEYFWEYSMPAFDEGRTPIKQKGADMHSNRTVICGKVLLFNKLNVRQKRIWLIEQCRDSAVCSSEFLPYKSDTINLELLSQILYTDKVTLEFIGMSTGTSNSQKRITPDSFLEYKVYLPVNEKEQAAIANVFSCIDNEIEALEQKLAKTCQLKQGMMQQLLTGKIRLV